MFKQNDFVITSKGKFGRIVSSNTENSIVRMGSKSYEIHNLQITLASKLIAINIEYVEDIELKKEIIWIEKESVIFDFSNPLSSSFVELCKNKLIQRIGNKKIIVQKLSVA